MNSKNYTKNNRKFIQGLRSVKDILPSKIKNLINAEPEVRVDKVAELKAKIKSGEYEVDSETLAKKMLEDAFQEDNS